MTSGKEQADIIDNDLDLIRQAEEVIKDDRLLVAARLLRRVKVQTLLNALHHDVLYKAQLLEEVIALHLQPPSQDRPWKKQSESHGHRDTIIHYQFQEMDKSQLKFRIETPIESSLLVPLLAIMNESELYDTWMPQFKFPVKAGVRQSHKLCDKPISRGAQIVQLVFDSPFPWNDREVIFETWGTNCVDDDENPNLFACTGISLNVGAENGLVQAPAKGVTRVDLNFGMVIRPCPPDHPCLAKSKHKYPEGEHLLLFSLTQQMNYHVKMVPLSLINFVTRTMMPVIWGSILKVAEKVRDGKRPEHENLIAEKEELYGWVNRLVGRLFENLEDQVTRLS